MAFPPTNAVYKAEFTIPLTDGESMQELVEWMAASNAESEMYQERLRLQKLLAQSVPTGYGMTRLGQILRTESRKCRNDPCQCGSGRKFKKCCGKW